MSNIKVIEKKGNLPGKSIVITAGIHGNEVCGIEAFNELIPSINIEKGNVFFIYGNLKAIKENKRFIEKNLNRCFIVPQPKEIENSLEGKTAKEIIKILDKCEVLLDIHASNSPDSIPFIVCEPNNFQIAEYLSFKKVVSNFDKFEPGSTEHYMNLKGKQGIGIECGYIKDKAGKELAKQTIIDFLTINEAISGKVSKKKKEYYKITELYKNKKEAFLKSKEFKDFEELKSKTLMGKEGQLPIYRDKGFALFVRDRKDINSECFLIAEKLTL